MNDNKPISIHCFDGTAYNIGSGSLIAEMFQYIDAAALDSNTQSLTDLDNQITTTDIKYYLPGPGAKSTANYPTPGSNRSSGAISDWMITANPFKKGRVRGLVSGEGLTDNIDAARSSTDLNLHRDYSKIVVIGWSRGAVAAIEFVIKAAHAIKEREIAQLKDAAQADISVLKSQLEKAAQENPTLAEELQRQIQEKKSALTKAIKEHTGTQFYLFLNDPVMGQQQILQKLPDNVKVCWVTLSMRENRREFAPQDDKHIAPKQGDAQNTDLQFFPLLDSHSGIVRKDTHSERIVRTLAREFMQKECGVTFKESAKDEMRQKGYFSSDKEIVEHYVQSQINNKPAKDPSIIYTKRKRTFISRIDLLVEDHEYFVNNHHRDKFMACYPKAYACLTSTEESNTNALEVAFKLENVDEFSQKYLRAIANINKLEYTINHIFETLLPDYMGSDEDNGQALQYANIVIDELYTNLKQGKFSMVAELTQEIDAALKLLFPRRIDNFSTEKVGKAIKDIAKKHGLSHTDRILIVLAKFIGFIANAVELVINPATALELVINPTTAFSPNMVERWHKKKQQTSKYKITQLLGQFSTLAKSEPVASKRAVDSDLVGEQKDSVGTSTVFKKH